MSLQAFLVFGSMLLQLDATTAVPPADTSKLRIPLENMAVVDDLIWASKQGDALGFAKVVGAGATASIPGQTNVPLTVSTLEFLATRCEEDRPPKASPKWVQTHYRCNIPESPILAATFWLNDGRVSKLHVSPPVPVPPALYRPNR